MSTYQGRIKNPIRGGGNPEELHRGFAFKPTLTNLRRWKARWRVTQLETFATFVVGLLVIATITMTFAAEYASGTNLGAVDMWLNEIIPQLDPLAQALLYALLIIALFSTQYASIEIFVRNSVDIIYGEYGQRAGWDVGRIYFGALTIFCLWGAVIIGFQFQQPFILLVLGGAAAGVMMWPYNALTTILNTTRLPEHLQPSWPRVIAMWWATAFFGFFSVLLISNMIIRLFGFGVFSTTVDVVGSGFGGYLLWAIGLAVQIYTMYRSAQAKLNADGTVDEASEASSFLG